jgi:RHS repeat-associated protein
VSRKKILLFFKGLDYYAFGDPMVGRTFTGASGYKYGFNGHEKDDEINGSGNSYSTEFRQYDPRLGRWLSIDPIKKPAESPYVGFANNPISFGDPDGKDTLRMHLQQVNSPAKNSVIFKVTFELIVKGASKIVEAPMNLSGSSDIYFGMPKENYRGGNVLSKSGYDIYFQRMASHWQLSKEWNENTILIDPPSGESDRGQFAHPGNSLDASAGCFIPTEFPSSSTIKNIPANPAEMMAAY